MTFYIIGSGGHASVIADILLSRGDPAPVHLHQSELAAEYDAAAGDVVIVGIGDNHARRTIAESLARDINGCRFGTAIHPSAVIARDVEVAPGTVVMAGAIVNTRSRIGGHVILNTGCVVDHDCTIADYASLAPMVALGGAAVIGKTSAIGIGACISHRCEVGEETVIGAGSVVVTSLPSFSVCYGSPAKVVRERKTGEQYL